MHVPRWAIAALVAVGGCGAAVVVAPLSVPTLAPLGGVSVGAARWCSSGLCLEHISRRGIQAESAVLGWDRRLQLRTVRVAAPDVAAVGGGIGFNPRQLFTTIEVEDLQVAGTPLPALSGQVWPVRALAGEGVSVEGDTVHATLPTPFGELAIDARHNETGVIELIATCAACSAPAPGPDDTALRLPPLNLRGTWADNTFDGLVRVEGVVVHVVARRGDGEPTATLDLKPTSIAAFYGIVSAWVPEVGRARIEGTVAGTARLRWDGALHLDELSPTLQGFSVDGLVPDDLGRGPFRFNGRDPAGQPAVFIRGAGTREWVSLAELGIWLPAAVIATEDAGFRQHAGYSLEGIREAASDNAVQGDIVRGGSTLTQQLAKNLFLDGTRSYARKLRELLYAVELERELGKSRILELYLNVVEFGPGMRGAGPAADLYFLKRPVGLLPEEAAWMASILRNPKTAFKTQYLADAVDTRRIDWILGNLRGVPEAQRDAARGRTVRLVPPP